MAKTQRFNPPPGWPPPPAGWRPPPDWRPEPSWGPVPQGWPLWVTAPVNPGAWGWALLSAAGWAVVLTVVGLVVSGGRFGAEAFGEVLGRELMAGLLAGLVASLVRSHWRPWAYPLAVFAASLVIIAVTMAGRT